MVPAEWSALISRGQEKWLERVRARVLKLASLSSWSLSGFGNNATTIFFACQGAHANVGNSIRVTFQYSQVFRGSFLQQRERERSWIAGNRTGFTRERFRSIKRLRVHTPAYRLFYSLFVLIVADEESSSSDNEWLNVLHRSGGWRLAGLWYEFV